MAEPFTASLIWLGQVAGAAIVGRLAERAVGRVLDEPRQTVALPDASPRRHLLGNETSDLDIVVQHTPAGPRAVLLAFQTAPDRAVDGTPSGVTVPMVFGETAHLTLPRDHYLISALVLDPPARLGGKPVLHGVGWMLHWVASNTTRRLTITTTAPTKELLVELGLQSQEGTGPFTLLPAVTTTPRQNPRPPGPAALIAPGPSPEPKFLLFEAEQEYDERCRAQARPFNRRCTGVVSAFSDNGLCRDHDRKWERGAPVFDWTTRQRIPRIL